MTKSTETAEARVAPNPLAPGAVALEVDLASMKCEVWGWKKGSRGFGRFWDSGLRALTEHARGNGARSSGLGAQDLDFKALQ